MKRFYLIITLLGAVVLTSCGATKSVASSEADEAQRQYVEHMLQKRSYKVDFSRAYPSSGSSFILNYSYFISVIGDRVESFLPYFGRAYSIPYGGGEGLRFDAPITNYKISQGKKGKQLITFNARTAEDSYIFNLEVYPTGESYLTVISNQKQSISFSGEMDLDPEFEAIRIK